MAGTKAGGVKAAQRNLAKNPNFYRDIGKIGGRNGHTGGFASNPELARVAGAKGGRKSRRYYKLISQRNGTRTYRHIKTGKIVYFDFNETDKKYVLSR